MFGKLLFLYICLLFRLSNENLYMDVSKSKY